MRRFFYNHLFRPLAWAIPVSILVRLMDLPHDWRMWVFMALAGVLDVIVDVLFPYAKKPTRNPVR